VREYYFTDNQGFLCTVGFCALRHLKFEIALVTQHTVRRNEIPNKIVILIELIPQFNHKCVAKIKNYNY
jgi:hypothetical protein